MNSSGISQENEEIDAFLRLREAYASSGSIEDALSVAVRRHPLFASSLADYALQLALEQAAEPSSVDDVRQVKDRARTVLQSLRSRKSAPEQDIASLAATARRLGLEWNSLASRIGVSLSVLTKAERRLIDVATVPSLFINRLAHELSLTTNEIRYYLSKPSALARSASYRSKQQPAAGGRQGRESFMTSIETAAGAGELSAETVAFWNAEMGAGGDGQS